MLQAKVLLRSIAIPVPAPIRTSRKRFLPRNYGTNNKRLIGSVAFINRKESLQELQACNSPQLTDPNHTIASTESYDVLKSSRDQRMKSREHSLSPHTVGCVKLDSEMDLYRHFSIPSKEKEEFEDESLIGTGTYGTVYRAIDLKDNTEVAIKEMGKGSQPHFRREIEMLKRIRNNKGCVRLLKVFETKDKVFLVTELLHGGDLFDYIVDNNVYLGNMTVKEALTLTRTMLCSLEVCHLADFAHLDVKPENFVFRSNTIDFNDLVLVDFGAAQPFKLRPFAREREQYVGGMDDFWIGLPETHIGGTASYVSPEVVIQGRFSSRSDIWSMGVTLYMMLTGQRPFEVDDHDGVDDTHSQSVADKQIQFQIKAEAEKDANESIFKTCKDIQQLPTGVRKLLQELTQPDPALRPSTTEAIHYIDKLIQQL